MAADPIYVETEEEIPEVVERMRRTTSQDTMLVLPARSRVGQSRFNFQLLKNYASRMGKKVTVVCDDPGARQPDLPNRLAGLQDHRREGRASGAGHGSGRLHQRSLPAAVPEPRLRVARPRLPEGPAPEGQQGRPRVRPDLAEYARAMEQHRDRHRPGGH